jgi:hypothetical protein
LKPQSRDVRGSVSAVALFVALLSMGGVAALFG